MDQISKMAKKTDDEKEEEHQKEAKPVNQWTSEPVNQWTSEREYSNRRQIHKNTQNEQWNWNKNKGKNTKTHKTHDKIDK